MARQLVIRPVLLLGLAGCAEELPYEGAFDMPTGVTVLSPAHGPFEQPVGFVANGVGGQIVQLDLKYGRFLTDDPTASFLRGNFLPTGGARMLTDVAAWAPTPSEVTLFAADRAFSTLVRVPYVIGLDDRGFPIEGFVVDGEPHERPFVADVRSVGSGGATLEDVELKLGSSATETWTVEFSPERRGWLVTGSRSGPQDELARSGERFVASKRRIAFTIRGSGEAGDRFEIDVESGVREVDVGGNPLAIEMSPDHSVLALAVQTDGASVLRWFAPADETLVDVPLAPDASPGRMAWAPDGNLIVADNQRPAFWVVAGDGSGAVEHPMPWPTMDIAPLYTEEDGRLVYVVPMTGQEVWIYDLDAGAFRDVNPSMPGVQGMDFVSPVLGIEAIPLRHLYRDRDNAGERRSGRSVAVSLHRNGVVFMEHPSGCLQQDEFGPRSELLRGTLGNVLDYETNFDEGGGRPTLQRNTGDDRRIVVNRCAGIAVNDEWTVTFDRTLGAWVVRSDLRGVQQGLAFEDERYVSDRGEVSFLIRAGNEPTEDGWQFRFRVIDGVLAANGVEDREDGEDIPFAVPGDPVFFSYTVGPTDVPWDRIDERAFVLVPAQASDVVGRVDPQEGDVEVAWD